MSDKLKTEPCSECNGASKEYEILKKLCVNNAEYFSKDSSENGQRLYISFLAIIDAVDAICPKIAHIENYVAEFDFDDETPGNGYRSFIHVAHLAFKHGIELNERVILRRSSMLFRKTVLTKDIESCSHLISSLNTCFEHLGTLMSWSADGNLFPKEEHSAEKLLELCDNINQYCFYGRSIGFQFCESLKNVLQFITLSMAIFSEAFYSQGSLISKATNSFMTSTKYIVDPEQRAKRIVNISQNADVDFCKAFWFLSESELMNQLPSVVSPTVAVSKVINISPETLILNINDREVTIDPPSSHIGNKPIQIRLISHRVREGMMGTKNMKVLEPTSRGLLIHCHGGGFVSQSSKSHECYLRDWAKHLDVPILSVDYSLAPEAPFPRALEEVFYVYCWILKHHTLLGSTGERIVAAGDSAGANLLLSTTLKCINSDIPPPVGIFVAYVPTVVNFIPSPARLLCMMDPLLPFGFLMRCLKAYACPDPVTVGCDCDTDSFEEITESDMLDLQAHKSPTSDTSDTLTFGSLTSNSDQIENDVNVSLSDVEKSQKYVAEFLEKYGIDSDTDTDVNRTPQPENTSSSVSVDSSLQTKVSSIFSNVWGYLNKLKLERAPSGAEKYLDVHRQSSIMEEFKFINVPKDPYLSPYYAADEDLKRFPPTRILTVHLDPCLDDCIMFAKKLKVLGNDVKLDLLHGLPHGFLNFSLISKEAYEGSMLCIQRINELLDLDNLPTIPLKQL